MRIDNLNGHPGSPEPTSVHPSRLAEVHRISDS